MIRKKPSLTDLVSLDELQEMQDSFSEVANVAVRTVDPQGLDITKISSPPSLCSEVFNNLVLKEKVCGGCRPTFLGGEGIVDDDLSFECLPGLKNYLLPLKVSLSSTKSLILGYIIIGPVIFMKRRSKEEFKEVAEAMGFDHYELWSLILELRVFSYQGVHSFLSMIDNLTGHILNLAYAKFNMQKNVFGKLSKKTPQKISLPVEQMKEFLELFLDLVINVTKGNVGSVMLFDRTKRSLVIKAAHGLPEEVIRETQVKIGEGVSGLVAQTKKSFLINEGAADKLISERLTKPNLFSSMVVPIRHRDDVYGVVNVSSDKASAVKFDESTLAFLTKAAGLAGVTLERIQAS